MNRSWADKLGYDYELWSDLDRVLADHYRVLVTDDALPMRHAYLLDGQGRAVLFYEGAVSLGADPRRVLQDAERWLDGSTVP